MKRRRTSSPPVQQAAVSSLHCSSSVSRHHLHPQHPRASVGEVLGLLLVLLSLLVGGCRGCLQCKLKPPAQKDPKQSGGDSRGVAGGGGGGGSSGSSRAWQAEEALLFLSEVSALQHCLLGGAGSGGQVVSGLALKLPLGHLEPVRRSAELAAALLGTLTAADQNLLESFLERAIKSSPDVIGGRLLWIGTGNRSSPQFALQADLDGGSEPVIREGTGLPHGDAPWLNETSHKRHGGHLGSAEDSSWSNPYFVCEFRRWMVSYTAFAYPDKTRRVTDRLGLVSLSVDATAMDINQCDEGTAAADEGSRVTPQQYSEGSRPQVQVFRGTHKCHNLTSQCQFTSGEGWTRGAYVCRCRAGFYSPAGLSVFNGTLVESAWTDRQTVGSPTYDKLYACKACQPGCDVCNDDSPCLAHYNWAFRISLLVVSLLCIVLTVVLSLYVYRYRKLKVIKVASPIFLCITLLGCAIMYSEMAAIFPVLDVYSCVATKWTRHMGFCITYSALLLKTWRVSLTYRVKSAHKLKLTDKQLLHWLFPILLVMAIYLGTWTISATPEAVYILDWQKLKFKQCDFNWWDHSLAIGEFLFLLWGIRVCYSVRNAESFFNEAKHISWAVYSITLVNIFMVMIHLVILPNASPDVKYLFGFIRTQMSTTATTILIFGPKFYRVVKGQGDTWDNRARARGVTASFSLNGVGLMHEETPDLYQENEELKEEIQKLAAQIEFMKIVHMELNNRHLKPKHSSFFSLQPGSAQSPIVKSIYMKFESTDSPGSRISPAAELVSERV